MLYGAFLPLFLHQSDPLLQTGSLQLQSLYVVSQGRQAGLQVHCLLPALSQGDLPNLPPLQQGHDPRLVPALQCLHAAAQPPLQPDRCLSALADITHGPWPAGLSSLVPKGVELVMVGLLELGQLLSQTLDVGLELLLQTHIKLIISHLTLHAAVSTICSTFCFTMQYIQYGTLEHANWRDNYNKMKESHTMSHLSM